MKNSKRQIFFSNALVVSVVLFIMVYPGMPGRDISYFLGACFGAMVIGFPVAFIITYFQTRNKSKTETKK